MGNIYGQIIKEMVTIYIIYLFIFSFTVTSFSYLTYRFWKMILPKKEEIKVFITNAPVIGHNYNEEEF